MLFIRGKGCPSCNFTGFFGRRPIAEVWVPTTDDLQFICKRPDNLTLRQYALTRKLFPTMLDDGIVRVRRGETTLEEVLRVVPYTQLDEFNKRMEQKLFSWDGN
jgi:type II secretory ATPase GspE/PulE/Tfp pilus assembly ATPase PilB-like protein